MLKEIGHPERQSDIRNYSHWDTQEMVRLTNLRSYSVGAGFGWVHRFYVDVYFQGNRSECNSHLGDIGAPATLGPDLLADSLFEI